MWLQLQEERSGDRRSCRDMNSNPEIGCLYFYRPIVWPVIHLMLIIIFMAFLTAILGHCEAGRDSVFLGTCNWTGSHTDLFLFKSPHMVYWVMETVSLSAAVTLHRCDGVRVTMACFAFLDTIFFESSLKKIYPVSSETHFLWNSCMQSPHSSREMIK